MVANPVAEDRQLSPELHERLLGGSLAERGGRVVPARDPALLDPGALGDPLVVGVDQLLEVRVGQDVGGDGDAQSHDLGDGHGGSFLRADGSVGGQKGRRLSRIWPGVTSSPSQARWAITQPRKGLRTGMLAAPLRTSPSRSPGST